MRVSLGKVFFAYDAEQKIIQKPLGKPNSVAILSHRGPNRTLYRDRPNQVNENYSHYTVMFLKLLLTMTIVVVVTIHAVGAIVCCDNHHIRRGLLFIEGLFSFLWT